MQPAIQRKTRASPCVGTMRIVTGKTLRILYSLDTRKKLLSRKRKRKKEVHPRQVHKLLSVRNVLYVYYRTKCVKDDEGSQGSQLTRKASTVQSKTKDADETSTSSKGNSRPALKRSNSSVSQPDLNSGIRPGLELYKAVMKVQLNDNKIGVEGKKLLKKFR